MNLYYFNFYVQKSFCQFNSFMSTFPKHLTSQRLQIEVKKQKVNISIYRLSIKWSVHDNLPSTKSVREQMYWDTLIRFGVKQKHISFSPLVNWNGIWRFGFKDTLPTL